MQHIPVLLTETIQSLKVQKNGIYIDGTFGNGGHTKEILKNLGKKGMILGIDTDPQAYQIGKKILDPRLILINDKYSNIQKHILNYNLKKKINGLILDLGISSFQLDNPKRGFSFQKKGPLDMRMNPQIGISLLQLLNKISEKKLTKILYKFGNEKYSKKIAFEIFKHHKKKPISNTLELAEIIKKTIPFKNMLKHPATRTFLALRIFLNQEIKELKKILKISLKILKPGAILSIISFHSIEDRIVKKFFKKNSSAIEIPMGLPINELQLKKKIKKK